MSITIKKSSNANKILNDFLQKVANDNSLAIEKEAKALVPVDTGKLKESIEVVKNGNNYNIGSSLPYALIVEMGSRFKSPVAYLRRAFWKIIK